MIKGKKWAVEMPLVGSDPIPILFAVILHPVISLTSKSRGVLFHYLQVLWGEVPAAQLNSGTTSLHS